MSLTGKQTRSLRKVDLQEQKSQYMGYKRLMFAHKATLGDTGIDLGALVTPSAEMPTFVNPTGSQIMAANLQLFKNNLILISSLRGALMLDLSYTIRNNRINFIDFTAESGEIFTGTFEYSRLGTIPMVDARPLSVTGTLTAGTTDFAVGEGFQLFAKPLEQVGDVVVYRNGVQQFRCEGNVLTGEGNYIEVGSGNTASLIRFKNTAGTDDSVMVCSIGSLVERPQESMMQYLESVAGKVDSLVPTVAALAGVPESNFGGVTNVDLKVFGDVVNALLESNVPITAAPVTITPTITHLSGALSNATSTATWYRDKNRLIFSGRTVFSAASSAFSSFLITLPNSLQMDFSSMPTKMIGKAAFLNDGLAWYPGGAMVSTSTTVVLYCVAASTTYGEFNNISNTVPFTFAAGDTIDWDIEVPIIGWSQTQTLRQQLGL